MWHGLWCIPLLLADGDRCTLVQAQCQSQEMSLGERAVLMAAAAANLVARPRDQAAAQATLGQALLHSFWIKLQQLQQQPAEAPDAVAPAAAPFLQQALQAGAYTPLTSPIATPTAAAAASLAINADAMHLLDAFQRGVAALQQALDIALDHQLLPLAYSTALELCFCYSLRVPEHSCLQQAAPPGLWQAPGSTAAAVLQLRQPLAAATYLAMAQAAASCAALKDTFLAAASAETSGGSTEQGSQRSSTRHPEAQLWQQLQLLQDTLPAPASNVHYRQLLQALHMGITSSRLLLARPADLHPAAQQFPGSTPATPLSGAAAPATSAEASPTLLQLLAALPEDLLLLLLHLDQATQELHVLAANVPQPQPPVSSPSSPGPKGGVEATAAGKQGSAAVKTQPPLPASVRDKSSPAKSVVLACVQLPAGQLQLLLSNLASYQRWVVPS